MIHNEVINTDPEAAFFFFFEKSQWCVYGCGVGVIASPWGRLKMSGVIFLVTAWKNGMEKGATVITWIESREISNHSKVQALHHLHLHQQEVTEKLMVQRLRNPY